MSLPARFGIRTSTDLVLDGAALVIGGDVPGVAEASSVAVGVENVVTVGVRSQGVEPGRHVIHPWSFLGENYPRRVESVDQCRFGDNFGPVPAQPGHGVVHRAVFGSGEQDRLASSSPCHSPRTLRSPASGRTGRRVDGGRVQHSRSFRGPDLVGFAAGAAGHRRLRQIQIEHGLHGVHFLGQGQPVADRAGDGHRDGGLPGRGQVRPNQAGQIGTDPGGGELAAVTVPGHVGDLLTEGGGHDAGHGDDNHRHQHADLADRGGESVDVAAGVANVVGVLGDLLAPEREQGRDGVGMVTAFLVWAPVFWLPEHVCSVGGRKGAVGRRGGSGSAGRAQRSERGRSAAGGRLPWPAGPGSSNP